MTKILDLPSKKILIQDLAGCSRVKNEAGNKDANKKIKEWMLYILGKTIKFSVVWLQGIVTQVENGEDCVIINDDTGEAKIVGCSKFPYMSSKLKTGQYVLIIGQLISSGNCPVLRALKVQNLNQMVDSQSTWKLEVMDQIINVD